MRGAPRRRVMLKLISHIEVISYIEVTHIKVAYIKVAYIKVTHLCRISKNTEVSNFSHRSHSYQSHPSL